MPAEFESDNRKKSRRRRLFFRLSCGKRIGDTLINGAYDAETNTIYLRADAAYNATDVRGILGHTLAHEVTHSIKTWSEADYNVLTDYIRDALEADFDALVKEKMDKLGMSYAMASDEVIADGCEMLLRDSKALEKLATENASLFVKVVTKVREFVANLRKAQTDMYGGREELHDASLKLREALKSLEEVQEVFDNALENSIRNMRDALAEAENAKTRENLDVLEKQAEKEGINVSEDGLQMSEEYDKFGNKYWRIETSKDIFAGLKSNEQIEKAAYDYLLENRDYNVVLDTVDGKKVKFIRLSADEFTKSKNSQNLKSNNPVVFKQKMRLIPSLQDLLLNANVNWHADDMKNHRLFKERGFENYRGKLGIDDTIFNYVVRVGEASFGNVFYDINLEVDSYLPHAESASDIKGNESTSTLMISDSGENVNSKLQNSEEISVGLQ